jgi:hypothetical protein
MLGTVLCCLGWCSLDDGLLEPETFRAELAVTYFSRKAKKKVKWSACEGLADSSWLTDPLEGWGRLSLHLSHFSALCIWQLTAVALRYLHTQVAQFMCGCVVCLSCRIVVEALQSVRMPQHTQDSETAPCESESPSIQLAAAVANQLEETGILDYVRHQLLVVKEDWFCAHDMLKKWAGPKVGTCCCCCCCCCCCW